MFISEFLNKIEMERLIRDFKNDGFYLSYHFGLLKEHIRYESNYNNTKERRKDYLNAIDLGLELNIFETEDAIKFFLYRIKDEMYEIPDEEVFDFLIPLFLLINKYKSIIKDLEESLGKKNDSVKLKKFYLKELEEIHEILNNRITK